jgi:iron-sulfur cluster insertion protein
MSAIAENIVPTPQADDAPPRAAGLHRQRREQGQGTGRRGRQPDLKLRVFVQGGGCSGFQYGFTFDEIVNDDDTQMAKNGVTLLIDAMSLQYLGRRRDRLQGRPARRADS